MFVIKCTVKLYNSKTRLHLLLFKRPFQNLPSLHFCLLTYLLTMYLHLLTYVLTIYLFIYLLTPFFIFLTLFTYLLTYLLTLSCIYLLVYYLLMYYLFIYWFTNVFPYCTTLALKQRVLHNLWPHFNCFERSPNHRNKWELERRENASACK